MRKTFKYRIYPNRKQEKALESTLDACRWVYNHFLEQRKDAWENEQKSISMYDQSNSLSGLKARHQFLQDVHSQLLQNVSTRVDLAFRAFFFRLKRGQKPGYPRFRGRHRYDSFCFPQKGYKLHDNYIKLSKIGNIKVRQHRPVEGKIKTCTVRRSATGKWFVSLACEIDYIPAPQPVMPVVGLDMGVSTFIARSDGEMVDNPRFLRQEEKALAKAQRKLSKQVKGSKERSKARKVVARVHERIANKRHNFAHQESRKLVNEFNTIVIEDLKINDMRSHRSLNKSIRDAAWRMFLNNLEHKAEEAGGQVVKVNPAYTSQTCSRCGHRQKLKLSERVYDCLMCNLSLDRDHNAAINIMTLGT